MSKNVSKVILLLGLFLFLFSACSINRRGPSRSPTTSKAPLTKKAKLRSEMIDYALTFEGAKYKYGGNGPKSFDCSGLTHKVYEKFNVQVPRTSTTQASLGKKIPMHQAQPGDLAFFRKGSSGGKINHVALVVSYGREGLKVIHSTTSRGVVVENVSQSNYWKPRLLYVKNVLGK